MSIATGAIQDGYKIKMSSCTSKWLRSNVCSQTLFFILYGDFQDHHWQLLWVAFSGRWSMRQGRWMSWFNFREYFRFSIKARFPGKITSPLNCHVSIISSEAGVLRETKKSEVYSIFQPIKNARHQVLKMKLSVWKVWEAAFSHLLVEKMDMYFWKMTVIWMLDEDN